MGIVDVVLTNDVLGLGDIGQKVTVKSGYARNYLIPKGLAFETKSRKGKQVEHKMLQVLSKSKKLKKEAESFADKLRSSEVVFQLKKSESGKVFGSVSSKNIYEKLAEQELAVDKKRIILPVALKKEGTSLVGIKLHPEVSVQLKVNIVCEKVANEENEGEEIAPDVTETENIES